MQTSNTRLALVTGANKGIGLEIAREIGKAGNQVIVGARDAQRGEAAAETLRSEGIDARYVHIDLEDPSSIAAAAAAIDAGQGRLDILVNNAGVTSPGDGWPGAANVDAVRRTFETNFFGTLELTQAMLPLLKKSASGRIVNVSSGLGSMALNGDPDSAFAAYKFVGYNGSKAALNMLTIQLAAELKDTGIKVNAADPGFTATDLNGHRGHQTVQEGAVSAVRLALLADDGPTGGFFDANGVVLW